jgi:hypothetical protein
MTVGQFLINWMVRSAILTFAGALLLRTFRVRDASFRLASWTAILCASVALPILSGILPRVPLVLPRGELLSLRAVAAPSVRSDAAFSPGFSGPIESDGAAKARPNLALVKDFDWGFSWSDAVISLYALVCAILLLRIAVGLAIGARLRCRSIPTALHGVHESNGVNTPVTLGIVRPAIVLPVDWHGWDRARLDAVLAHERSHVERWDPAVQLFSAIHRALLWASPLSWFLHAKLVQSAEEASDDAAARVCDRVGYVEILMEFMKRKASDPIWTGLSMARYGNLEKRLLRILDRPVLSSGVTKRAALAIIGVSLPVACLTAATNAEFAPGLDEVWGLPALEVSYPSPPSVVAAKARFEPRKAKFAAPAPVLAQVVAQTPAPLNRESGAAEVGLTVSVTDPAGRYVTGLTAQDFRITTGQIAPDISSFSLAAAQHSVVLLNTIANGDDAVKALRNVLDSGDQLAVLAGSPASDTGIFWDAVATAVNQAKGMTNPYKGVVVMMRGGSDYPMAREADLAKILRLALHSPRVTVSFANVEDITTPYLGPLSQQGDMRILAAATGGQAVPAANVGEMATSLTRIGLGLIHQYVLGFAPANAHVGALGRPPKVEVVTNGVPFQVIGPGGYYTEP